MPTAADLLASAALARREGRLDDASRHYQTALTLARAINEPMLLIAALKGLAQIERDLDNPAQAEPLYREAIVHCHGMDAPLLVAHTVRHLGDVLCDLGQLDEAADCYDEALATYRAHPGTTLLDLANALRPMALLCERLGDTPQALKLWAEARQRYADAGIEAGVAECDRHLAQAARSA